jgi:hypothetical protein
MSIRGVVTTRAPLNISRFVERPGCLGTGVTRLDWLIPSVIYMIRLRYIGLNPDQEKNVF